MTTPLAIMMWSLKTGGLCQHVQLHWNVGPSTRNIWFFKTLMAVVFQDRFHCVTDLQALKRQSMMKNAQSLFLLLIISWNWTQNLTSASTLSYTLLLYYFYVLQLTLLSLPPENIYLRATSPNSKSFFSNCQRWKWRHKSSIVYKIPFWGPNDVL